MILRAGSEPEARHIFEKWELDFAVIGRVTDTGRLVLHAGGEIAADIPVGPLVTEAPVYRRPWRAAPIPSRKSTRLCSPNATRSNARSGSSPCQRSPPSAGSGSSTTTS